MVGGHNIIIIIDIPGNQRPRGENPCAKCRRVVSSGGTWTTMRMRLVMVMLMVPVKIGWKFNGSLFQRQRIL